MADFKLNVNNIVKLRNGQYGVVEGFNNKPHMFIFSGYTSNILKQYDGPHYKKANDESRKYDVVAVYDGTSIENVQDVYKKRKFDETVKSLPCIWAEAEEEKK